MSQVSSTRCTGDRFLLLSLKMECGKEVREREEDELKEGETIFY